MRIVICGGEAILVISLYEMLQDPGYLRIFRETLIWAASNHITRLEAEYDSTVLEVIVTGRP